MAVAVNEPIQDIPFFHINYRTDQRHIDMWRDPPPLAKGQGGYYVVHQ